MSCDEHDLRVISLLDLSLEIQPVDVWKFNIQNQTCRNVRLRIRKVFGSRTEGDCVQIKGR